MSEADAGLGDGKWNFVRGERGGVFGDEKGGDLAIPALVRHPKALIWASAERCSRELSGWAA